MENLVLKGVQAKLFIKKTDLDFVIKLLRTLRQNQILDYELEEIPETMEGPIFSIEEINRLMEKSENGEDISFEAMKAKYGF